MNNKIQLLQTESEVLERISNEVGQINKDVKASHSSGHGSSNGHWSSVYGSLETSENDVFSTESEVLERISNEVDQINKDVKASHSSGHGSSNGHWSSVYGSLKTSENEVLDRKSTRLNSSHEWISRMPSSA